MKLYNNKNGIIIVCILFIIWFINLSLRCPCNQNHIGKCLRLEFYGVQYNHFVFFTLMGLLFPSYFYIWMFLGILWELFEIILDMYPDFVIKYIGGCLSKPPDDFHINKNKKHFFYVYKDLNKYVNPIDKLFSIENSKIHGWHGSIAELIPNILGFLLGKIINEKLIS